MDFKKKKINKNKSCTVYYTVHDLFFTCKNNTEIKKANTKVAIPKTENSVGSNTKIELITKPIIQEKVCI